MAGDARVPEREPRTPIRAANGKRPRLLVAGLAGGLLIVGLHAHLRRAIPTEPGPPAATTADFAASPVPVADYMETVFAQTPQPAGVQKVADVSEIPPGSPDRVELVYFHATRRCSGCVTAETYVRNAHAAYARPDDPHAVVLKIEDYERPSDPELARTYGAAWSALYLGVVKRGITYVCPIEDIWFLLDDEAAFSRLIQEKLDAVLTGRRAGASDRGASDEAARARCHAWRS